MKINVTFTTQVKAALGCDGDVVSVESNATVMDVVAAVAAKYPSEFSTWVLADGLLLPSILICLNDQQVDSNTLVDDGDHVLLLSAISGG